MGALIALLAVIGVAIVVLVVANGGGSKPGTAANRAGRLTVKDSSKPSKSSAPQKSTPAGRLAAEMAKGNAKIRELAKLGLPVFCAGPHGNAVAFTFDDGPGPYTHYALKKLTAAHQRATFFVVGRSMDNFPGWLPKELKVAAIGDHTYTHPELTALSADEVSSEILRTKTKIEAAAKQSVDLFRPPYGAHNATVDNIAKQNGLLEIIWNIDSADSLGANYAGIIKNVEAGLHPGSIILMHENRGQTIRALTTILPYMAAHHIKSVSLPELFATDPPSVAQLKKGGYGCSATASSATGAGSAT
jgi:peptidoglycan/xylan/chitin deacetylase (PgdA/CDA1 family)